MSILTWNNGIGTLQKDGDVRYNIYSKPALTFNFDVLIYEPQIGNSVYFYENTPQNLTNDQITEIESFILAFDLTPKHSINEYSMYVGLQPDTGKFTVVPSAPPTPTENWIYVDNNWVYVHGVDANGHYMGNVPAQLCALIASSAPSGYLTLWDDTNKVWVDERTTEQVREDAIRQINFQRDAALMAGFTFSGQTFHCDPVFQSQIQSYLLAWNEGLIDINSTVTIRRKDNVTVQMTKAEVLAMAAAMIAHVEAIYAQSWAAKDAL